MELESTFPIVIGTEDKETGRFVFRYPKKNDSAEMRIKIQGVEPIEMEGFLEDFMTKHLVSIENVSFDGEPLTIERFKSGDYPSWFYGHLSSVFLSRIGSGDDEQKKFLGIASLNGSSGSSLSNQA